MLCDWSCLYVLVLFGSWLLKYLLFTCAIDINKVMLS